ncbi:MAG: hypothetical protein K0Q81_1679, partial [Paenibacillus sp.]|nr:hypothetical protein [Paenibacillus sp.]
GSGTLQLFETYPGKHSHLIREKTYSRGWIPYPQTMWGSMQRVSDKSGIPLPTPIETGKQT